MGVPATYLKKGVLVASPASDEVAIIAEADGSLKSLAADGTRSAIGGGGGFAAVLARAQTLLNSQTIVKAFGTDFDAAWWHVPSVGGTGSASESTTERGGVLNVASGATGGSTAVVRAAGNPGLIINPTTELWYQRWRARLATTIDANSYVSMGVVAAGGGNPGLYIGGLGLRSTANFTYDFYNNAGASTVNGSLGVALDTNFHVFEMLGDATNIRVYIDSTLRLTVAIPASTTSSCGPYLGVQNGGTAANQQLNVDDMITCTAG